MTFQKTVDEQEGILGQSELAPLYRGNADAEQKIAYAQKAKHVVINLFISFHLLAIACWCVPVDSPLIPLGRSLVRPYFFWAGLFQSWDMFAPVPKGANTYIEATLGYRDGSRKTWTYPRMQHMSLTEKFFKERYRKFADNLQRDDLDDLVLDAARHIARLNSSPGNPVKTVILTQRLSFIIPRADGSYVPEPWESHILLGYGVQPEDLR
jgi:hypothetical protein